MNVNIKDYIIDPDKSKKERVEKKNRVNNVKFELILENDMDFIIKRTSPKSDKDLVILVSQDLFYIKDNKKNIVEKLTRGNYKTLMSVFLRNYCHDIVFKKNKWCDSFIKDKLLKIICDNESRLFIKEGIYNANAIRNSSNSIKLLKKNKKVFKYYYEKIGEFQYGKLIESIIWLIDNVNYNNAIYLIDKLVSNCNYSKYGDFYYTFKFANLYKLDINTLIDYLTSGLYSQGIEEFDWHTRDIYIDYLDMNFAIYGKVKDKYPKYLRTMHDKTRMKYNFWKKYKQDLELIKISKEHMNLKYSDSKYSIVIPENSADILNEGIAMSNCVASYIKRVCNEETFICFMRNNDNLDESLVTVEVKNNCVRQCLGYANRRTTKEENKFIEKWAKKNNLTITYIN